MGDWWKKTGKKKKKKEGNLPQRNKANKRSDRISDKKTKTNQTSITGYTTDLGRKENKQKQSTDDNPGNSAGINARNLLVGEVGGNTTQN